MGTDNLNSDSKIEWPTLSDTLFFLRFVLGVVLVVATSLMLTTAPDMFQIWLYRRGYQQTEVRLEHVSPWSRATVRVLATDEKLSIKTSTFDNPEQLGTRRVWYNPRAFVRAGIIWFDGRIVARHDPREATYGLIPMAVMIGFGVATWYVWRGLWNSSGPKKYARPRRAELRARLREKRRRGARADASGAGRK
jgi:hypothetical protein